MILVGSQRGGAVDLARHLLKQENEHIEVHELRGFASDNLTDALNEAYAVSRGTKCRQFLFSLSLNPPQGERVGVADFESAIDRVESELGLAGQPRVVVFHEKEGRRHAHCVWSRIDVGQMKAVQLSFTHNKLQAISRALYLDHGWTMPRGLAVSEGRDPRNFTLAEWQQARRLGKDPRAIKAAIRDAWAISDTLNSFRHALEERGFKLARGDRRGFVAVDHQGEVFSLPKWIGVKTKDLRARLGDENALSGISEAKHQIAQDMTSVATRWIEKVDREAEKHQAQFERQRLALVQRQRVARQQLDEKLEQRRAEESRVRQSRFRSGFKGLWDRLRGEHKRVRLHNQQEAAAADERDRKERDVLVSVQLEQRQRFRVDRLSHRKELERQRQELDEEMEALKQDPERVRLRRRRLERSYR